MKSLLKYFKGYLWETFLGPAFKLLEAIFELCVPLIIAHLVDQVIPKKETSAVVMTVGVFVFICELWGCRSYYGPVFFF